MITARIRAIATAVALIAATFSMAGCNESRSPVRPEGGIGFSAAAADTTIGAIQYLNFEAIVINHGNASVVYRADCGMNTWFRVYDASGEQLRMHSADGGQVCPLEPLVLLPKRSARAAFLFGVAWDDQGAPYRPAPGAYTVYTRFFYFDGDSEEQQRADLKTVIQWQ